MQAAIWTGMCAECLLAEALRTLAAQGWRAFEPSTEHLECLEADPDPDARIAEVWDCLAQLGLVMPQAHALLKANVAAADEAERARDIARLGRHIEIAEWLLTLCSTRG